MRFAFVRPGADETGAEARRWPNSVRAWLAIAGALVTLLAFAVAGVEQWHDIRTASAHPPWADTDPHSVLRVPRADEDFGDPTIKWSVGLKETVWLTPGFMNKGRWRRSATVLVSTSPTMANNQEPLLGDGVNVTVKPGQPVTVRGVTLTWIGWYRSHNGLGEAAYLKVDPPGIAIPTWRGGLP